MSIMYLSRCILFLALTSSPIVSELVLRVIYSAHIHNEQYEPIECYVVWLKPSGGTARGDSFTIEVNEQHLVDENLILKGSQMVPLEMREVHCGELVLKAPFDGVDATKTSWEFFVQEDQIISGQKD